MKAILYPATLPGVASWSSKPAERTTISKERGRSNPRALKHERVRLDDVAWDLSDAESAIFKAWFENELLFGQRKCVIVLPGAGGFVPRLVQFRAGLPKRSVTDAGYTVTASLIVRRYLS